MFVSFEPDLTLDRIAPQKSLLNEHHVKHLHPTHVLQVSLGIAPGRGGVHTGTQPTDGKMSGREN